ncbi:glycosyltransferase [Butyrivibrio sp. AE3004]|uniref:glycosyltransferase n=1 Tax=Butyrivibrio sp. AE3004 TaxID=1506994 RepID=UPI000494443E|nr:glycosyltransferase [Butyrivibrio sp. AE3004]
MKKNVILTDTIVDDKWEFASGVQIGSKLEWSIVCWDNAGIIKNKLFNMRRIIGYFWHAFSIFIRRQRYEKIISWQQFYGLIFAYYCILFRTKKTVELTVMTFIYKKKEGCLGNLYFRFIKKILQSGYIDYIVVFSKNEVNYYSELFDVNAALFTYMPLGIPEKKKLEATTIQLPEKFFLSVGRSNRDYDFLFRCANELSQYNIVVITDTLDHITDIPNNVYIFNTIRGEEYLKILDRCEAVLIPLKEQNISSGQLVMLQAMQYKKPIIITESNSICEYVKNEINALIVPKMISEFCNAVKTIANDNCVLEKLASNGYDIFQKNFSLKVLGSRVGELYLTK